MSTVGFMCTVSSSQTMTIWRQVAFHLATCTIILQTEVVAKRSRLHAQLSGDQLLPTVNS